MDALPYVCSMHMQYFQITFHLQVMGQGVAADDLTGGICLGAFSYLPCNNIVSF